MRVNDHKHPTSPTLSLTDVPVTNGRHRGDQCWWVGGTRLGTQSASLEKRFPRFGYIAFAIDGTARMQQLINDLLTYSRVGSRVHTRIPTNCDAVLTQVLYNLSVVITECQAQITHDPLPTLQSDPIQLEQLFQNLIGNAIKFRGQAAPKVHISAQREGSQWIFSIRDNGIGIEAEYRDEMFVIFKRLHTREEFPGTGLGLAICKKIVERHEGRIWFDSEPGNGSTFYFSLPIGSNLP